jgi:hypothetical protein
LTGLTTFFAAIFSILLLHLDFGKHLVLKILF